MSTICEASFTQTTGPLYTGAIIRAVCKGEVVAPPTRSGIRKPEASMARAVFTISSRLGVIKPLRPTRSALLSMASCTMRSAGHITPRSRIS